MSPTHWPSFWLGATYAAVLVPLVIVAGCALWLHLSTPRKRQHSALEKFYIRSLDNE